MDFGDGLKQDGIFVASALTTSSFVLDGFEYSQVASLQGVADQGEPVYVAFTGGPRRQPLILGSASGRGRRKLPYSPFYNPQTSTYGVWMQAEANPGCNRIVRDSSAPFPWLDSGNTLSTLLTMYRYYYDSTLQGGAPGSLAFLYSPEGVVLGDGVQAAMSSLYEETDGSLVGYYVRLEPSGLEWTILNPDPIGADLGLSYHATRRQGYLFHDPLTGYLTVAGRQGLHFLYDDAGPQQALCAWEATYDPLPPESGVSVAWDFALQGAHLGYDGIFGAGNCAVHCYQRTDLAWAHVAKITLPDQMSGCDYVRACGGIDLYEDPPFEVLNSRWPYLPSGQEWLVWVAGRAGDLGSVTLAKRKLLAIKATTGAVRVLEDKPAPLVLRYPKDATTLQSELEAGLTYNSTPHPDRWETPGGGVWFDPEGGTVSKGAISYNPDPEGDPAVWSDAGVAGAQFEIPWDQRPPEGYGTSFAQEITVYGGAWSNANDPTVAPDCQRLACDDTSREDGYDYPRGVVDGNTSRYVVAEREACWMAQGARTTLDSSSYTLSGYEDFHSGDLGGVDPGNGDMFRLYKFTRNVTSAGFSFGFDATSTPRRCMLRLYTPSAQAWELDLTREFDQAGDLYHQEPWIWEYVVAGNYIWVLASDWWAYNDQRLTLILVNLSGLELTRFDLQPEGGSGELFNIASRPQLIGGSDGTGPYVQVMANWSTSGWVAQTLRYNGASITRTQAAHTSSDDSAPDRIPQEACNVALDGAGSAYWIETGTTLRKATA